MTHCIMPTIFLTIGVYTQSLPDTRFIISYLYNSTLLAKIPGVICDCIPCIIQSLTLPSLTFFAHSSFE